MKLQARIEVMQNMLAFPAALGVFTKRKPGRNANLNHSLRNAMKLNLIEEREILDFEKGFRFELEVNERPKHTGLSRFYVYFKGGDVIEGAVLVRHSGNGSTIDEALQDYCNQISCKKMVFNAGTSQKEEIQLPALVHTKLLGR